MKKRSKITKRATKTARHTSAKSVLRRKNPDIDKVILSTYFILTLDAIYRKVKNDPQSLFNLSKNSLFIILNTVQEISKTLNIKLSKLSKSLESVNEAMLHIVATLSILHDKVTKYPLIIYDLNSTILEKFNTDLYIISDYLDMPLQSPPSEHTPENFKQFLVNTAKTKKLFGLNGTQAGFPKSVRQLTLT